MIDLSAATIKKQTEELDELIKKPIYSISPDALAAYDAMRAGAQPDASPAASSGAEPGAKPSD